MDDDIQGGHPCQCCLAFYRGAAFCFQPERARRRISWIGKDPLPRLGQSLVHLVKYLHRKKHFASNFDELWVARARQGQGNGGHVVDVLGDVLAGNAIAPGCRAG